MDKETYLTHNALVFRVVWRQMFDFLPNIFAIWPQSRSDYIHSLFSILTVMLSLKLKSFPLFFILTGHAVADQVIPFSILF
jgi:hypothetical protein